MKRKIAAAAVLGVAAAACGAPPTPAAPAPSAAPPRAPENAALDDWAEREVAPGAPSAVLGLVDATGLRWHRGLGSRDARGGPRPDRTTVYRIGSVTKLITGTAVLQLRDAGVLDLDAPVTRWVPELAALGASQPPVTLRHLVTHTSGIPRLGDGSAVYWEQRPPDRAALLRALGAPLEFAPGARYVYSNAGIALAGEIVARAAGEPFRAYATRRVLEPLGMRTAVWDRADVPPERLAIGIAEGVFDPPHWQLGSFEPTGGLYASLDDMVAFARFALGGAPGVLAPASLAEAQRDDPLPGDHGIAWVAESDGGLRYAWHNGATAAYSAALFALPERGLAAIALVVGDELDLADCAAKALVRAAATGTAPGPCASALAAAKRAAADAGLALLRRVLDDPSPAAIGAAFDPEFLAELPAAQVVERARHLRERFGRCARHEILEPGGLGMRAVLHCERGTVQLEIAAAAEPPHLIWSVRFADL